jgi:hypothetical protein
MTRVKVVGSPGTTRLPTRRLSKRGGCYPKPTRDPNHILQSTRLSTWVILLSWSGDPLPTRGVGGHGSQSLTQAPRAKLEVEGWCKTYLFIAFLDRSRWVRKGSVRNKVQNINIDRAINYYFVSTPLVKVEKAWRNTCQVTKFIQVHSSRNNRYCVNCAHRGVGRA